MAGSVQCWLTVAGDDAQIDHNTFQHKSTIGNFIEVVGPGGSGMAQRTWIHHNYFLDQSYSGGNGGESIRVGLSGRQHSSAYAIVEDNLFEACNGDLEVISVKSSDDTIRYNTLRNSKGTITLRHGWRNVVEGNFLLGNATGIRMFGNYHRVVKQRHRELHRAGHGGRQRRGPGRHHQRYQPRGRRPRAGRFQHLRQRPVLADPDGRRRQGVRAERRDRGGQHRQRQRLRGQAERRDEPALPGQHPLRAVRRRHARQRIHHRQPAAGPGLPRSLPAFRRQPGDRRGPRHLRRRRARHGRAEPDRHQGRRRRRVRRGRPAARAAHHRRRGSGRGGQRRQLRAEERHHGHRRVPPPSPSASPTAAPPTNAGTTTVRATATTAGGGPNVDYIDVQQP